MVTCQVHPGNRHQSAFAVPQRVMSLITEVHIFDLDVHGVGLNPVPVLWKVTGHRSTITHLRETNIIRSITQDHQLQFCTNKMTPK